MDEWCEISVRLSLLNASSCEESDLAKCEAAHFCIGFCLKKMMGTENVVVSQNSCRITGPDYFSLPRGKHTGRIRKSWIGVAEEK